MENNEKRINITDILLFIVFLLLLAFPGYLCYKVIIEHQKATPVSNTKEDTTQVPDTNDTESNTQTSETPSGPHYEEMFKTISGQEAYIAVPTNIDATNPPAIVLYSHGSNTLVTSDTTDPFVKDLQAYGVLFTGSNFIFAASNEHGENWGNTNSIDDMLNLEQWIQTKYTTSPKIYLIGFSMGGLPTMHFADKYPANITKIALLAPTTRTYEWNSTEVKKIESITIKIWHGTSDVNIPVSSSRNFVKYMKSLGKDITLVELQGKTHFDVDAEYMNDILEFFLAN